MSGQFEQFRKLFDAQVVALNGKKDESSSHLTAEKYKWIMQRLRELKVGDRIKKVPKDYRILKTYQLSAGISIKGNVIEKLQKAGTSLFYVSHDELFDVINEIHLSTAHGARDVMHDKAKKKYVNVTKEVLQLYSDLCGECQLKKRKVRKSIDVKPIISNALNSRGQVDLIDMESQPDGQYHFIMSYHDLLTKFVCLKPLCTKQVEEVANELINIFCIFGSPHILHSNYGREFTNDIVKEVTRLWPECVLVHGKPHDSQSQSCIERANQDVGGILAGWMKENSTIHWSAGLRFVQWQKNNYAHTDLKRSPFAAMFSEPSRLGLKSTHLPNETIAGLQSEEDLDRVLNLNSWTTEDSKQDNPEGSKITQGSKTVLKCSIVTKDRKREAPERLKTAIKIVPITNSISSVDIASNIELQSASGIDLPAFAPSEDLLTRSGIKFETTCSVCEFAYVGNLKCSVCYNFCHAKAPCSKVLDHVGSESKVLLCLLCQTSKRKGGRNEENQCNENKNIGEHTEKPIDPAEKRLKPAEVRANVWAPVSDVDKRRGTFRTMGIATVTTEGKGCCSMAHLKPIQSCKPFAYKPR